MKQNYSLLDNILSRPSEKPEKWILCRCAKEYGGSVDAAIVLFQLSSEKLQHNIFFFWGGGGVRPDGKTHRFKNFKRFARYL